MPRLRIIGLLSALVCCTAGCGKPDPKANALSGSVTLNGEPLQLAMPVTIFAVGSDNTEAGGLIKNGKYVIVNPPKGQLRFKVFAVPPAPEGAPPPAAPSVPPEASAAIPVKYQTPDNGLTFEYRGGKQAFDIALLP